MTAIFPKIQPQFADGELESGVPKRKWRIFVAEDHAVVREGVKLLLQSQPDMEIVGEAGDGESAWRGIREIAPDVAVVDVAMPGLNGAQLTERLRAGAPNVRVLALSAYADAAHIRALVEAGAAGYVLKRAAAAELTGAIRTVARGETHFPADLLPNADDSEGRVFGNDVQLSPREVDIVKLVAWGHSNKEIAARLHLSVKTVEGYKTRLFEKLGLHSRVELVRYALKRDWLCEE